MRRPRPLAVTVIALLALLGCGSTTTDGGQSAPTAPATTDRPPSLDQLVTEIPSAELRTLVGEAAGHATDAGSCVDTASWIASATAAADLLRTAATAVEADPDPLGEWRYSEAAQRLADSIQEQLVDVPSCPGEGVDDVLAVSGEVSGSIDVFRTATTPGLLGIASGFWLNFDYLGHTIEARRLSEAGTPVDVVLIGDSTVKRGFDPLTLSDATAQTVLNASTDGQLPTMSGPWLDELTEVGVQAETVVIGVTSWGAIVPCDDARTTLLTAYEDSRARAFAGLADWSGVPDAVRTIGEPETAYTSPLLDRYRRSHPDGGQGQFQDAEALHADAVQAQVAYHTRLFADPRVCEDAASTFETEVTELVAAGERVIIVAMPVSEAMAALHPDRRAGHDALFERYRETADAAGAEFLDLSTALSEDQFRDPAHPGPDGRRVLTDALVAVLG